MNTQVLDEFLPSMPEEELTERLLALRAALGADFLGIARCLHARVPHDPTLVFRVLQVVSQTGAVENPELALPLAAYRELFLQARSLVVNRDSEDPLSAWLRGRSFDGLVGWPFPGDRMPCVAFLAAASANWVPGELRLRVAREGMEALARSLGPPTWLLRSMAGARQEPLPKRPREHGRPEPAGNEVELLRRALRRARGNKSRAARSLHLSRQVFYQKLKIHGILTEE
jgi:hypothetical protein